MNISGYVRQLAGDIRGHVLAVGHLRGPTYQICVSAPHPKASPAVRQCARLALSLRAQSSTNISLYSSVPKRTNIV
jgi:hypothetical protein